MTTPALPLHLLFYDGECGLCDHAVQFVLKADKEKRFCFAPLQGATASKVLESLSPTYKKRDSLILIENFNTPSQSRIMIRSQGAFRILWLLGGAWRLLGWLSFLPSFLFDPFYRWVARCRHHFFKTSCPAPTQETRERFLP